MLPHEEFDHLPWHTLNDPPPRWQRGQRFETYDDEIPELSVPISTLHEGVQDKLFNRNAALQEKIANGAKEKLNAAQSKYQDLFRERDTYHSNTPSYYKKNMEAKLARQRNRIRQYDEVYRRALKSFRNIRHMQNTWSDSD
jgi:hypothetical protein